MGGILFLVFCFFGTFSLKGFLKGLGFREGYIYRGCCTSSYKRCKRGSEKRGPRRVTLKVPFRKAPARLTGMVTWTAR